MTTRPTIPPPAILHLSPEYDDSLTTSFSTQRRHFSNQPWSTFFTDKNTSPSHPVFRHHPSLTRSPVSSFYLFHVCFGFYMFFILISCKVMVCVRIVRFVFSLGFPYSVRAGWVTAMAEGCGVLGLAPFSSFRFFLALSSLVGPSRGTGLLTSLFPILSV